MPRDLLFTILYGGVGIYLILIIRGWIHKALDLKGPRKFAVGLMAGGFLVLGLYHAGRYYRFSGPEGQELLRQMRKQEGNVIISPFE